MEYTIYKTHEVKFRITGIPLSRYRVFELNIFNF